MLAIVDAPLVPRDVEAAVVWPGAGAVLTFSGIARDNFEGRPVRALEYEAYPELALPVLQQISNEVKEQWPGARVAMVHRTGRLGISEPSVVISVATPHRAACYAASRYAIDALKARLPVWKKEIYDDGAAWKANAEGTSLPPAGRGERS
ncbi:MAG: molybdenum cofactor biosynthesis protein MoaE [Myxococcota bacterium]|nr:molybdenum cofactor biosynthesis protein MoaE [Myxococcota bacterium]MEC8425826.1 molybdenum cofactor biosynthesis protein MoaE [Myxococcota bacterium]